MKKLTQYCPTCNRIVEVEIIFNYFYDIQQQNEFQKQGTNVALGKCIKCENPMLFSEELIQIEGNEYSQGITQLYPVNESKYNSNVPIAVIKPYKEALICYKVNAYEACVIMCRKGIDAICQDKGQVSGNLMNKLKNLKDNSILEETFYNWSDELRIVGNLGAHSHDSEINKQVAKDTLEFFEALILYLYHLVEKYTAFKARRENNQI